MNKLKHAIIWKIQKKIICALVCAWKRNGSNQFEMCRAWSLNYVNFTMHKSYVVCLHTPAESRWERDKNVASLFFLQTFQCFQNSPALLSYFRVNKCSVEKGMRNPNALENQTGSFQYKLQRIMLAVPVYFFKFKIFLIFLPEKKKPVSLKGGWSDF